MNKEKKGYGIVIPADWTVGKWDTLTPQDIIEQLKALTCDAFYRMSRAVDLDLDLLETSGYEYDGLSEIAVIELEAFLNAEKFQEVRECITRADFQKNNDFQYVFHRYNGLHNALIDFYSEKKSSEILKFREYVLRDERELMLQLEQVFIDEFVDDKTPAREIVLEKYGGHFIAMPELDSLLLYRDDIEWYHGDTFDSEYKEDIQRFKAMRDLTPLYELISKGGDFQIQSAKFKHQKVTINSASTEILAKAVALALKMLHDTDPYLCPGANIDKTYTWADLICAGAGDEFHEILASINSSIESYEDESDLSLFYYLAYNAIVWPTNMTLTQRHLFLYRLAKFFHYVSESEYDTTVSLNVRKEISEAIKFRINQVQKRDKDGEIFESFRQEDDL